MTFYSPNSEDIIRNFLEKLNTFESFDSSKLLDETMLQKLLDYPAPSLLEGEDELWAGLIRLFYETAQCEEPQTVYIFTDHPEGVFPPSFETEPLAFSVFNRFAERGHKLITINCVEKKATSVLNIVSERLQLYIGGAITPYYCQSEGKPLLLHHLIVSPNVGAITSAVVPSMMDEAVHLYSTDANQLLYRKKQAEALLAQAEPIMEFFSPKDLEKCRKKIKMASSSPKPSITLLPSLPVQLVSPELMEQILDNNGVGGEDRSFCLEYHREQVVSFERSMENAPITDIFPICTELDVATGEKEIQIPEFVLKKPIYYTINEYYQHLSLLSNYVSNNRNYKMLISKEALYPNLQIVARSSNYIYIRYMKSPCPSFLITNPALCSAFFSYVSNIRNQLLNYT